MLISYATLHDSHEGDASMDLACKAYNCESSGFGKEAD